MGLKTTNYVSKSTGITLPNAYAKIKDLVLNGNRGRAIFAIQASRESADKFAPIDKVEVNFTWDRKTNLAEAAYQAAKTEEHPYERFNRETLKIEKGTEYGTLYGWGDDKI